MQVLIWHVHGGWMTSFVHGPHRYLLPSSGGEGGRSGYDWPESAEGVPSEQLRDRDVDVVVLQRPADIEETTRLLGRRPGQDVPAVFLEHNTPRGDIPSTVHPLSDRSDIPVVHVTHFNRLFWDSGRAPTTVIEHGIVDPGLRYTGEQRALGVVINEPVRRWRVTGTDLLPAFAPVAPVHVFGINQHPREAALAELDGVRHCGDLRPDELHRELSTRRAYLHPVRWTSLGLSLLEAMHLGMPVLALATTEASRAVPPEAGAISTDIGDLVAAARMLMDDPDEAGRRGRVAREVALERYGLAQFLRRWDEVLDDTVSAFHRRHRSP